MFDIFTVATGIFMLIEMILILKLWSRFRYLNTRLEYAIKINRAEHEILKGNK